MNFRSAAPAKPVLRKPTVAPAPTPEVRREPAPQPNAAGADAWSTLALGGPAAPVLQPKLEVGSADDPLERQADATADAVMRMPDPASHPGSATGCDAGSGSEPHIFTLDDEFKAEGTGAALHRKCDACAREDEAMVRRAPGSSPSSSGNILRPGGKGMEGGGSAAPASVHETLRSPGTPLDAGTRAFFEPRLRRSLADVRIHTDATAAQSARDVDAHAWTVGSHLAFSPGRYAPSTDTGQRLLAHELAHVGQQGGVVSSSDTNNHMTLRRSPADRWYGLSPIPGYESPGTRTHEYVLGLIMGDSANSQVFTEVNIPGGNRSTSLSGISSLGAVGRADLYTGSTTIGVRFDENGEPNFLAAHRDLRRGRSRYPHSRLAAPMGTTGAGIRSAVGRSAGGRVERLDQGPQQIEIGDLKPRADSEMRLGERQIGEYETGIRNTSNALAQFSMAHPDRVSVGSWHPVVGRVGSSSISIPSNLEPGAARRSIFEVVLFEGEHVIDRTRRRARLQTEWVGSHPGVLAYEFVPESGGERAGLSNLRNLSAAATPQLQGLLRRLREAPDRRAGHAHDDFNLGSWLGDWQHWRGTYGRPFERGPGASELLHLEAMREIARRSRVPDTSPADATQIIRAGRQVLHWEDWGSLHGRLRSVFGLLYVRAVELYERVSSWVRDRLHRTQPRSASTGLAARVARLAFTVLRTFATATAAQVAVILGDAVRGGVRTQLERLFADSGLEQIETQISSLREIVEQVEAYLAAAVEEQMRAVLGPFAEWVDQFSNIEEIFSTITNVVDVVKWAVRIAGCGAPPALGCLWSVIGVQVLETLASRLMETCWFRREVLVPGMNGVALIRDIPRWIAEHLHGGLVELMPEAARPWLGTVPSALPALRGEDVECESDAGRPSQDPATLAFLEIVQEFGEEYGNELLRTLQHLAEAGGSTVLTEAMVRQVQSLGRDHRAAGGTAESLRRWRAGVSAGQRTWEQAVSTLRAAILDGSVTRDVGRARSVERDPSITTSRPVSPPRPSIRFGPVDPVSPRDLPNPRPSGGGAGITVEF